MSAALSAQRLKRSQLIGMLSESLGFDVAGQVVDEAASATGCYGDEFDRREALAILEHLAGREGLVGVVARFVKARVLLSMK